MALAQGRIGGSRPEASRALGAGAPVNSDRVDLSIARLRAMVPPELQAFSHWVLWRWEVRDGERTKVPYDANTGRRAATNRPETWASFARALAILAADRRFAGLGFVFARNDPFAGVDLDDCRDLTSGTLAAWAQTIVSRLGSYAEISPSGRGVKVFVRGALAPGPHRRGHVELYDVGRFFTTTGRHLRGTPRGVRDASAELRALQEEMAGSAGAPQRPVVTPHPAPLADETVLLRALTAAQGPAFARLWQGDWSRHPSRSEADLALCGRLAFWTGGDAERIDHLFRRSGLFRPKWDEIHAADGRTYGQLTVDRVLATLRSVYTPRPRRRRVDDDRPPIWERRRRRGGGLRLDDWLARPA